jgi:hypothetical protein
VAGERDFHIIIKQCQSQAIGVVWWSEGVTGMPRCSLFQFGQAGPH